MALSQELRKENQRSVLLEKKKAASKTRGRWQLIGVNIITTELGSPAFSAVQMCGYKDT